MTRTRRPSLTLADDKADAVLETEERVEAARSRERFRPIGGAPRDGTAIEVRHGPDQEIAVASWSGQNQGWIRHDDPLRRTLHRVTAWREV